MSDAIAFAPFDPAGVKIITGFPPNFREIVKRFPAAKMRHGVLFSHLDRIYNPSAVRIPRELLKHELVHCARQFETGVESWWERYLGDDTFMVAEELVAHRAEWASVRDEIPAPSLNRQRQMLASIAGRLSGPLYGHAVKVEDAVRLIAEAA